MNRFTKSVALPLLVILVAGVGVTAWIIMRELAPQEQSDNNQKTELFREVESPKGKLRVGLAGITSPGTSATKYGDVLAYLSKKLKRPFQLVQRKSYAEINQLLADDKLDMAFICTGGYLSVSDKVEIVAAPVFRGSSTYNSYIIVNKKSGLKTFQDLKGKSFAFTDPLSLSGYRYPRWLVAQEGSRPREYFGKIVYTYNHDNSIKRVQNGLVDGAAIDSLVYEYFYLTNPSAISNLSIIHRSPDMPAPPVVVSKSLDAGLKEKIKNIFKDMEDDPSGQILLERLALDRYATVGSPYIDLDGYLKMGRIYPADAEGAR